MSVAIAGYMFKGPLISVDDLKEQAGIYAIICMRNQRMYIIDVGESASVGTTVRNHPRKANWAKKCHGVVAFAVYYVPILLQPGKRVVIEQAIRKQYDIW